MEAVRGLQVDRRLYNVTKLKAQIALPANPINFSDRSSCG